VDTLNDIFRPSQGPSSFEQAIGDNIFHGFKLLDVEISSSIVFLFQGNMQSNLCFDFLSLHLFLTRRTSAVHEDVYFLL